MHTSHPFAHRINRNSTVDSICKTCFATVGTEENVEDLKVIEESHVCDPWKLQVIKAVNSGTSPFTRKKTSGPTG